jgi:hypothetical protein
MLKLLIPLLTAASFLISPHAEAQGGLMKKLKDKANQAMDRAADKAIGKEVEKQTGIPAGGNSGGTDANGKPVNRGGGGLTNTPPPDVKAKIAEAEQAKKSNQYAASRAALKEALQGVEIELGKEILKTLPATVVGLPTDAEKDRVMSTQWGWSNLTIQRVYSDKADKQLTIGIGNAGIYGGLAQLYFTNAAMVETYGEQQNVKKITVKGNNGFIQYEDSKGYTVLIGLGQASGIVWEAINFAGEQEVMTAVNSFDIDRIKKILGEQ